METNLDELRFVRWQSMYALIIGKVYTKIVMSFNSSFSTTMFYECVTELQRKIDIASNDAIQLLSQSNSNFKSNTYTTVTLTVSV